MLFSQKQQNRSAPNFFQDLEENTCSLKPVLKSTVPGLQNNYFGRKMRKIALFLLKKLQKSPSFCPRPRQLRAPLPDLRRLFLPH